MKFSAVVVGFGLVVLSAYAQPPDAKAYQEQEKRWQSCSDGYYSGPRPGRLNYDNDKYLWVVTPEFAKRFCMPEHMVDAELKGAEAIAFKRVPSEDGNDRCAVQADGKPHCVDDGVGRFEVYLKSDLNLPAAHPEVKFFDAERNHSYWHISGTETRRTRYMLYRKGLYQLPPGAINRFGNPYAHPDPGYGFALVSTWRKRSDHSIVDSLWEVGYRADWAPGIDLLILESRNLTEFSFLANHPRAKEWGGIERYAIVLADYRRGAKPHDEKRFPADYEHVVYLPKDFAERVKSAAEKLGTWNDVIHTFRQP